MSVADELARLEVLRRRGVLSEQEFADARTALLTDTLAGDEAPLLAEPVEEPSTPEAADSQDEAGRAPWHARRRAERLRWRSPHGNPGVVAVHVLWMVHVTAIWVALLIAGYEIRTVLSSGPLLAILGVVVAGVSLSQSYRAGAIGAMLTPAVCLFLFLLIALLQLPPDSAALPIYVIGGGHGLALTVFLVWVLRWRGRRGQREVRVAMSEWLYLTASEAAAEAGMDLEQLIALLLAERVMPTNSVEPFEARVPPEDGRFRGVQEWVVEADPKEQPE
jgi:hypothetical protein